MKVEMYRKRSVPCGFIVDDVAEIVFENVSNIRITQGYIFFYRDGENQKIRIDNRNYLYTVS